MFALEEQGDEDRQVGLAADLGGDLRVMECANVAGLLAYVLGFVTGNGHGQASRQLGTANVPQVKGQDSGDWQRRNAVSQRRALPQRRRDELFGSTKPNPPYPACHLLDLPGQLWR